MAAEFGKPFIETPPITNLTPEQIVFELTGKYPQRTKMGEQISNMLSFTGSQVAQRASQMRKALTFLIM